MQGPPLGPSYPVSHKHCPSWLLLVVAVWECSGQAVQEVAEFSLLLYVFTGHSVKRLRHVQQVYCMNMIFIVQRCVAKISMLWIMCKVTKSVQIKHTYLCCKKQTPIHVSINKSVAWPYLKNLGGAVFGPKRPMISKVCLRLKGWN